MAFGLASTDGGNAEGLSGTIPVPRQQLVITGTRLFGVHASEPLIKSIHGLDLLGMLSHVQIRSRRICHLRIPRRCPCNNLPPHNVHPCTLPLYGGLRPCKSSILTICRHDKGGIKDDTLNISDYTQPSIIAVFSALKE